MRWPTSCRSAAAELVEQADGKARHLLAVGLWRTEPAHEADDAAAADVADPGGLLDPLRVSGDEVLEQPLAKRPSARLDPGRLHALQHHVAQNRPGRHEVDALLVHSAHHEARFAVGPHESAPEL
jgi:hypothetical protein